MIGRQAYKHPQFLLEVDRVIFDDQEAVAMTMHDVINSYLDYVEDNLKIGVPLNSMTKHILNCFQGVPGAKCWRRYLSENSHKDNAGTEIISQALSKLH
jgi:tRNA-dihydrouridine synthase A